MKIRSARVIALQRAIEDLRMVEASSLVEDIDDAGFDVDRDPNHPDVTKVAEQLTLIVERLERQLLRLTAGMR